MPLKAISVRYRDIDIRAENTWFCGAKLFVDGICVDTNKKLFSVSKNNPLLKHQLNVNNEKFGIEVFCVAWLFVKLKICVNGVWVAGEDF